MVATPLSISGKGEANQGRWGESGLLHSLDGSMGALWADRQGFIKRVEVLVGSTGMEHGSYVFRTNKN